MSPAARMLRPHVLRRWRALAGAGGATLVLTLADLAKPWPLALVVDKLLGRPAPFALDAPDVRLLALMAGLVVLIAVAEAGARYASDLWLQKAGERISHDLRVRVYEHLQRLSLGFHQQRQKGDLVTRVTGDVNAMGDLFSQSLGAMVQAALLSFGMTVVLLVIDPLLALVSLSTAPVMAALSYAYRRRVRAQSRVRRAHEGEIASVANEALSAMSVVKAFGSEGYESRRVREGSERRLAAGVEVARLQARFDGLVGAVRAVSTAAVLVIGALRVSHGAISPGELLVFASYTRKAQSPMRSFARELTKVSATMAKADRVAELMAADEVLPEGSHRGGRARGEVELQAVRFGYGRRAVLDGFSLRLAPGERVALMGPSGAGKSTLGALAARFFDPGEGRVLLDGRDARDCALDWYREQVAVVLQDTVLFSGTVHENIAYASDATREQVIAVARAAAAHEFVEGLPDGYDTDLGPQGVALSGGQRQRIGIARTLLRNPPVLVLDEPTTGLDARAEAAVLHGLEALMRGRTALLITHSERLARTADRVVRLGGELEGLRDGVRVVYKPGEAVAVQHRDGTVTFRDLKRGREKVWPLREDPKLPALAAPPEELSRRLGLELPEAELIGYKPRARAVLRANGHVLKAYGSPRRFEAALAGLRAAAAFGPPLAAADPELRVIAQRAVPGRTPPSALDAARRAGAFVAELQAARIEGLTWRDPLRGPARKAELIAAVMPELRERLEALLARMQDTTPQGPAVTAHGDFHVDQLLVGDGLAVVDFDDLCLGAPALDLATYAADVVRGRDGDLDAVHEVLGPLLEGYGRTPEALEWHLRVAILGRAAHPFHRQLDGWRHRVEAMVRAAETARA